MPQIAWWFIGGALLALLIILVARSFPAWRARATGAADELEQLCDEAFATVEQLSQLSSLEKEDLCDEIEIFSAPVGGKPEVLRALIRFLPSHYDKDITGAALVLDVGREQGVDVAMTADELTASHIDLYELLDEQYGEKRRALVEVGTSKRSLDKAWVESQKDICFAMDHLDEYPMLLPIIRDRGFTDVREALEAAKVMAASGAKALSSGML